MFFTWFTLVTYSAQRHHSLSRVHFKATPFIRLSGPSVTSIHYMPSQQDGLRETYESQAAA